MDGVSYMYMHRNYMRLSCEGIQTPLYDHVTSSENYYVRQLTVKFPNQNWEFLLR